MRSINLISVSRSRSGGQTCFGLRNLREAARPGVTHAHPGAVQQCSLHKIADQQLGLVEKGLAGVEAAVALPRRSWQCYTPGIGRQRYHQEIGPAYTTAPASSACDRLSSSPV
jgi:hypothetical protein